MKTIIGIERGGGVRGWTKNYLEKVPNWNLEKV